MTEAVLEPTGTKGVVSDFSRDKQAFGVPWGKAMMWIFLLSDTFIFSCFLISYMSVRIASTDPKRKSRVEWCGCQSHQESLE